MQKTEQRNENSMHIDKASTSEMLKIIQQENFNAVSAVENALPQIEQACESIFEGMKNGGRLIYIGAGTSGRLGVLDAAECPPTFGVDRNTVMGIIAGGKEAMFCAAEGGEDNAEAGVRDIKEKNLTENDRVVGISAAGNAAYIIGALKFAKEQGCKTIGVTCNKGSLLDKISDISVVTDTGAEVITGSTRMKAGTAQKLVLNMFSTTAMIKMGNVYENLMINLRPSNEKLTRRMVSIVSEIKKCDLNEAHRLLDENDWNIRKAVEV